MDGEDLNGVGPDGVGRVELDGLVTQSRIRAVAAS